MKLRALIALAATALLLQGCNWSTVASTAGLAVGFIPLAQQTLAKPAPGSPAATMTRQSYDDSKNLYLSITKRGAAAFRSGVIPISTDADVARDNFCDLVAQGLEHVTDRGGQLSRLECLANAEVTRLADALDRGDAVSFAASKSKLAGYLTAMDTVITAAEKGTTP